MRATLGRPDGYVEAGTITVKGNRRLLVGMNLATLPCLLLSCASFGLVGVGLRPELSSIEMSFAEPGQAAWFLGSLAAAAVLVPALFIVVHEAVHGAAFWWYTRSRPVFGFTGWYAYASAPGWFLPRGQFVVVGLAPLVVLSALGVAALALAPLPVAGMALYGIVVNAGSSVGDLYLCLRVLRAPATTVVEDRRDGVSWYVPGAAEVVGPERSGPG